MKSSQFFRIFITWSKPNFRKLSRFLYQIPVENTYLMNSLPSFLIKEFFTKNLVRIVKMIRGRRELDHLKGENSPHVVSLIEKDNYYMYTLTCHMNGYSQGLIEVITDLMKSSS